MPPFTPLEEENAISCNKWNYVSPDAARLNYTFPSNTTSIFLNNLSPYAKVLGTLNVQSDTSLKSGYHVTLDIRGDLDINPFEVCFMLGKHTGTHGLGIYGVRDLLILARPDANSHSIL